jgi:hypothetical protein
MSALPGVPACLRRRLDEPAQRLARPREAGHGRTLGRANHGGDLGAGKTAQYLQRERLRIGTRQRHEGVTHFQPGRIGALVG